MEQIPTYLLVILAPVGLFILIEGAGLALRYFELLDEKSKILEPFFFNLLFKSDSKRIPLSWNRRNRIKYYSFHEEIMSALMGLDEPELNDLLSTYKEEYGLGAANYARKTYKKWEKGVVRPQRKTYERFLLHLPKVLTYDLKCEILRHLMETYGTKDDYDLTVYTHDWERTLEPLVKKIIDKPYNSALPEEIESSLLWLADDEMQIAEAILRRSQVEDGKIAVSMLREEFANIEEVLENTKGARRVTHKLKFPYGTINLEIKRRK